MSYDYEQKLKHPKWQKKRLEVLERDGWKCMVCQADNETLHVHHLIYLKGEPWDAPMSTLESLCWSCHEDREEFNKFFGIRTMRSSVFCKLLREYIGFSEDGLGYEGKRLIDNLMASVWGIRNKSLMTRMETESDADYGVRMTELNKSRPRASRRPPFLPPLEVENVTSEVAK